MRALRPLHGELPDICRDLRRERQPAGPDLPDAGRRRRPADDGAGSPRAPRALPGLPGLRVGLSVGGPVRPDDRAVQDRAPEGGAAVREGEPAPAADPPSPVPLPGASQGGAGARPAAATPGRPRLGRATRASLACCRRPCDGCRRCCRGSRGGRRGCRRSCRRSARSARGSRCSWVASPTRCSPRPTRRRPGCCSRTAARS